MASKNLHNGNIPEDLKTFQNVVRIAEGFLAQKKYDEAAVAAQIVAFSASHRHHGAFASPQLESILCAVGRKTAASASRINRSKKNSAEIRKTLHVLTAARDVCGDARFVSKWIHRDSSRSHSIALTCQGQHALPKTLLNEVVRTGGAVHVLDADCCNLIKRAKALKVLSCQADAIFLHVQPQDAVPVIAYGDKNNMPPVIYFAQADHQFWVGASVSDLVVHLRDSGAVLSEKRRGISKDRMAFLPIPLEPVTRQNSRREAKRKIGIQGDTVILLSIARAIKYSPIHSPTFVDLAVSVLNNHQNAILVVVGPDRKDQFQGGYEKTQGRILALGERSDTQYFYEAADIYIDSFPYASNTSLLEAGGYGLPLVSYFPFAEETAVLGAGAPGLEPDILRVKTPEEYEKTLSFLIENRESRLRIGENTKQSIEKVHGLKAWNYNLQGLYRRIEGLEVSENVWQLSEQTHVGEIDYMLNKLYSTHFPFGSIVSLYAHDLPYADRIKFISKMLTIDKTFSFCLFLPNRIGDFLSGHLKGWRSLPVVSSLLSASGLSQNICHY